MITGTVNTDSVWGITQQVYDSLPNINVTDCLKAYRELKESYTLQEEGGEYENAILVGSTLVYEVNGILIPRATWIDRLYGYIGMLNIRDELEELISEKEFNKVIIRINSPGGTCMASDEVCHTIENMPVKTVAFSEQNMTSIAYKMACACDSIVTTPNANLGSIGVILKTVKTPDDRVYTFKKGNLKDVGEPTRSMSLDEMLFYSNLIEKEYKDFIDYVSSRRDWPIDEIKKTESSYSPAKYAEFYTDEIVNRIEDLL